MKTLLEFVPLLAFVAAYYAGGIYVATGVLMVAMLALLLFDWLKERRVPPLHAISAALVFAFGGLTLAMHDQRFIQWKPTVFFWAVALAFWVSHWVGAKPLVQRLMEAALGAQAQLARGEWLRVSYMWVLFYVLMGVANLLVAWSFSEQVWVNFKVFGITALTFLFIVAQSLLISSWAERRNGD